ncbi:3-phosphoshikimate 1-carboxyvinyltransferase [Candidatus Bipolaricaulota bacterium]|nr:3-phosphoshikimate 1-carboxyvinyltransferase [Candidatus Bipolaricaulota bacterium]
MGVRRITGGDPLKGDMSVPGDKSISHRALLLGGLGEGVTSIRNLAPGEDVESTMKVLGELGVEVEDGGREVQVHGSGLGGFTEPDGPLDAGNSGTLMRLISGILAGQRFEATITGDTSLRSRPMDRIIGPLTEMGAIIRAEDGTAPLTITGSRLSGVTHRPNVASAQVKSCLLLAGLHAEGETTVVEPGPSRDHTERMLAAMGYPIEIAEEGITVNGPSPLEPIEVEVPGDFSSAAFFIAGGLLVEGSNLIIRDVGLNDTRTGFLDLVDKMGAKIEVKNRRVEEGEPRGDLRVRHSELSGVELGGEDVVKAIDELPLLGVVATQAEGRTVVRGAEELRVKETDRISATVDNLRSLGADVEELKDGFIVDGGGGLTGGTVDSYRDHRIAMGAAVAAQVATGSTRLTGTEWVEVSFPGFFEKLEELKNG